MRNTTAIGAAAEHLVCADLLVSGHSASIAAEGLSYDVIAEIDGRLFRIQVKGCQAPSIRSGRRNGPATYKFASCRNHRPNKHGEPTTLRTYGPDNIDIMALVAIDIRCVAYMPVTDTFVQGIHLFPPGTEPHFRNGRAERRTIDSFSLSAAIAELTNSKPPVCGYLP